MSQIARAWKSSELDLLRGTEFNRMCREDWTMFEPAILGDLEK